MSKRHILIIEDDPGIQLITKFTLEMDNYWQVTTANCGKEGLFKANNLHPDVILLDLIVPDLKGIEILQRLQSDRVTQKIPVVLFTAKLIESARSELKHSNVIGFINKPFDCLALSTEISNLLNCRFTDEQPFAPAY